MEYNNESSGHDGRIRLRVLGISYSQIQSGAYALILAQVDGPYRIPVVVGAAEAQSIAIKMEGIIPPRPMTHDLFATLSQAYGIELKDVFIHRFEDGIFSSELTFEDKNGVEVKLDARTSDAIAIAMRTQTPIFTTPEILEETGFIMEIKEAPAPDSDTEVSTEDGFNDPDPENCSIEELEELMARHIENEEYEEAARIKAIIASKK
ncbi:MAG: bifunctional nuclease family protein [Muribaculaceae bacterium]|nr:bifunctional nuclease family protein [Muribaculaceae bacterium]